MTVRVVEAKHLKSSKSNPDVVAAVLSSMLKNNPMAQVLGSLEQGAQDDTPLQDTASLETGGGDLDEETYKKLYNYNLSLTGSRPGNLPDPRFMIGLEMTF